MTRALNRADFRAVIVREVAKRLWRKRWFQGVCLDGVDDHYPDDLAGAIQRATIETWYWDGMR